MKKLIFSFILVVVLGLTFLAVAPVGAQGPYLGLEYGADTGLARQDIRTSVARIINVVLGLLGMISVVIVIYAGFKWMTSGGNEENAKAAQKILFAAVIGLIIILSAYAISRFVLTNVWKATTGISGSYESYTGDW